MRKLYIVFGLIAVFIVGFFAWWQSGTSAANPKDTALHLFIIPKGAAVRTIGNELKKEGLIRDPVVFFIYIKQNGLDHAIQAGSYRLSPSMNLAKILDTLGHGTVDAWVTIPEGLRAEEIAVILQKNVESYKPAWIESLKAEEGYLFPDTYLIPKDADVNNVIAIFKNNFTQKTASVGLNPNNPRFNNIIIMASLIEREAKFPEDRAKVASVIQNRLDNGIALQIDATAQYAYGYNVQARSWWKIPDASDLKISSPYNTYIHPGLPPAPICNPGLDSIKAAMNPASSNFVYYVNDKTGRLHFAETLSQHNANIEKYLNR